MKVQPLGPEAAAAAAPAPAAQLPDAFALSNKLYFIKSNNPDQRFIDCCINMFFNIESFMEIMRQTEDNLKKTLFTNAFKKINIVNLKLKNNNDFFNRFTTYNFYKLFGAIKIKATKTHGVIFTNLNKIPDGNTELVNLRKNIINLIGEDTVDNKDFYKMISIVYQRINKENGYNETSGFLNNIDDIYNLNNKLYIKDTNKDTIKDKIFKYGINIKEIISTDSLTEEQKRYDNFIIDEVGKDLSIISGNEYKQFGCLNSTVEILNYTFYDDEKDKTLEIDENEYRKNSKFELTFDDIVTVANLTTGNGDGGQAGKFCINIKNSEENNITEYKRIYKVIGKYLILKANNFNGKGFEGNDSKSDLKTLVAEYNLGLGINDEKYMLKFIVSYKDGSFSCYKYFNGGAGIGAGLPAGAQQADVGFRILNDGQGAQVKANLDALGNEVKNGICLAVYERT